MNSLITQEKVSQAFDWAYAKSINGFAGLASAEELAASYMSKGGSAYQQANSLIRYQYTKAATTGFLTGLGGALTLPITLPVNITSVLYIQVHMIAAVAHIGVTIFAMIG